MTGRYTMPYPVGWFQVAYSHDLEPGDAKPIRYFGEDMVLFRTESGQVHVLDAYCPHLGAHLGYGIHERMGRGGEVRGETIVCPFHGWRFDGDGRCVEVPYAHAMPPRMRDQQAIRAWSVCEKNQVIWLWYHPDGAPPAYEVVDVPEAAPGNVEWGDLDVHHWKLRTHVQEMAENAADPAHFHYVHGTAEMPHTAEIDFDGHRRTTLIKSSMNTPRGVVDGQIEAISNGPGQGLTRFSGICETVLLGNVTPIDEEYVDVNFAFIQKKVDGKTPRGGVSAAIVADICKQLEEDAPIWEHKIYRPVPILCDGDGPINKFRKWYQQFYPHYQPAKSDPRLEALGLL